MTTGVYDIDNVGLHRRLGGDQRGLDHRLPRRRPAGGGGRHRAHGRPVRGRDRHGSGRGAPAQPRAPVHRAVHDRRSARPTTSATTRRRSSWRSARPATTTLRAEQARRRAAGDPVALGIGIVGVRRDHRRRARAPSSARSSCSTAAGSGAHRLDAVRPGPRHDVGDDRGRPHRRARSSRSRSSTATPTTSASGGLTVGSRSVQIGGAAIAEATDQADRRWPAERAAELLEAAVDDVVLDDGAGRFHVAGTPARDARLGRRSAARRRRAARRPTRTSRRRCRRSRSAPTSPWSRSTPRPAHVGCAGSWRVDDAGTILNPLLAEGQVHGGIAQGVAQALLEEIVYDDDGQPKTTNFADYAVISAAELPSFELVHMETPTWVNELGAKGIGESGTIGAIPAVYNAVIDALSPPRRPPPRDAAHARAHLDVALHGSRRPDLRFPDTRRRRWRYDASGSVAVRRSSNHGGRPCRHSRPAVVHAVAAARPPRRRSVPASTTWC